METSWEQVSPTTFRQKRAVIEGFYSRIRGAIGQPSDWILTSTVRFANHNGLTTGETTAALKKAWLQARRDVPQIAATHDDDAATKIIELPANAAALTAWLDETFLIWPDKTADDVYRTAVNRRVATLIYCPAARELTLQINHAFMDGRGTLLFWNAFFDALADPQNVILSAETLLPNLPPSLDALIGIPETASDEAKAAVPEVLARASTARPIKTPVADLTRPPAGFGRRALRLSKAESSAVFAACRARNVTVTAALQIAAGIAVQEVQREVEGTAGDTWAGLANFDCRRYFPDEFAAARAMAACYFVVMPYTVSLSEETFDVAAKELSDRYRGGIKHRDAENVLEALPASTNVFVEAALAGVSSGNAPWYTALGIVDDYIKVRHGDWEVEDFKIANTLQGPMVQFLMWTFRGELVLHGAYNEAYYEPAYVDDLLARSVAALRRALGVTDGETSSSGDGPDQGANALAA
ncbi:hypothetical protein VDGD_02808 [Verticillium dahliae]|nr:hypothetical protein VDGD_02808 [Verticillium dahliae]